MINYNRKIKTYLRGDGLKITYLNHSGFLVEEENYSMVIDYYNPQRIKLIDDIVNSSLKASEKFYVLSSHSHEDHFDPKILSFKDIREDIQYIFSKDIEDIIINKDINPIYLEKSQVYKDDLIKIKAFGSTDIGISFYIESKYNKIFHAGDLNNWHWNEEFTEDETKEAEDYYHRELEYIKNEMSKLNIAMFPVDPRLGKDYMKGAMEFLEEIQVDLFFPMHFQGEYEKAWAFEEYAKLKNCKLIKFKDPGTTFDTKDYNNY